MKKSILILGGSRLQVPAILACKRFGLYVYVADYDKNAVGFQYADQALDISTLDQEAVYKAMLQYQPDYLITSTSDAPVAIVAQVLERLGRPTDIASADALCATNKAAMRQRLREFDVPIPEFSVISNEAEFVAAVQSYHYDCVSKPADSAGSRGVVLLTIDDRERLTDIYNYTLGYSRTECVLVEQRIFGTEVSVEALTIDGNTEVITITDKEKTPPPYVVEVGHSQPTGLSEEIQSEIINITKKTLNAIGLKNGGSHTEIMVTDDGPKVIETAARLGGDFISSKLVPLSTGVDMVDATIRLAIGLPISINKKQTSGSAIRFIQARPGIIKEIVGVNAAREIVGVQDIELYCGIGDLVQPLESSNNRLGHIIASGETSQEAIEACEKALAEIKIIVE